MNKPNTSTHSTAVVFKKNVDERSGREQTSVIHRGFVVGSTSTHNKVWSPEKDSGDGPDSDTAELFAKQSKRIWCVVTPPRDAKI